MWIVIALGEDNNAVGSGRKVSLEAREVMYTLIYISEQDEKKDVMSKIDQV